MTMIAQHIAGVSRRGFLGKGIVSGNYEIVYQQLVSFSAFLLRVDWIRSCYSSSIVVFLQLHDCPRIDKAHDIDGWINWDMLD
jgi:hypothetical protein